MADDMPADIEAESLYTESTGLCADSIECVPGIRGLFALATYQVDKEELLASTSARGEKKFGDDESDERNGADDKVQSSEVEFSPAYTRRGTCTLHEVSSASSTTDAALYCHALQTIDSPAILDMKWSVTTAHSTASASSKRAILGIANAKGEIELQQLAESPNRLDHLRTLTMNSSGGETLCLSLDWSDRRGGFLHGYDFQIHSESTEGKDTSLVVSQSDGSLCYLPSLEAGLCDSGSEIPSTQAHSSARTHISEPETDSQDDWDQTSQDDREESLIAAHTELNRSFATRPRGLETWKAHEYEAWIVGFDCWLSGAGTKSVVWSGGDDLSLRGWDLRTSNGPSGRTPTFTTSKCFDGGVTTLQSSHLRQHLWAVGSYDSKLRLFDARSPMRPLVETDMGGGIWRVKWHPTDPSKLLVGCMHDGFKVVSLSQLSDPNALAKASDSLRGSEFEIIKRFDQHSSLAYGCDWDRHAEETQLAEDRLVYSCSFYDATLHVWRS